MPARPARSCHFASACPRGRALSLCAGAHPDRAKVPAVAASNNIHAPVAALFLAERPFHTELKRLTFVLISRKKNLHRIYELAGSPLVIRDWVNPRRRPRARNRENPNSRGRARGRRRAGRLHMVFQTCSKQPSLWPPIPPTLRRTVLRDAPLWKYERAVEDATPPKTTKILSRRWSACAVSSAGRVTKSLRDRSAGVLAGLELPKSARFRPSQGLSRRGRQRSTDFVTRPGQLGDIGPR